MPFDSPLRYGPLLVAILALASLPGCRPERQSLIKIRAAEKARKPLPPESRGVGTRAMRVDAANKGLVLAAGTDFEITAEDFAAALGRQPLALRARYNQPERWEEFLQDMVAMEVLARQAVDEGLQRDPLVLHAAKKVLADQWLDEAAGRAVGPADISDAAVEKAYEGRPELSTIEAMVHAYVLSGDDLPKVQEARKKLDEVIDEFDRVVARMKDMQRSHGDPALGVGETGDAGFIRADGIGRRNNRDVRMIPEVVSRALFETFEANTLLGPVHTERGFMIVAVTEVREEERRPLSEVRQHIRNVLVSEARAGARIRIADELVAKAGLKVDPAAFEKAFGVRYSSAAAPEEAPKDPGAASASETEPALKMRINPLDHRRIVAPRADAEKHRKMLEERGSVPGETAR